MDRPISMRAAGGRARIVLVMAVAAVLQIAAAPVGHAQALLAPQFAEYCDGRFGPENRAFCQGVLYGIGSLASQIAAPRACPPPDATIERLRELVVQQGASERFAQRDAIGAALLIFSEAFPCR